MKALPCERGLTPALHQGAATGSRHLDSNRPPMLVRFAHNAKILFCIWLYVLPQQHRKSPAGGLKREAYARRLIKSERSGRCVTFCGEDEIKDDRVQNLVRGIKSQLRE